MRRRKVFLIKLACVSLVLFSFCGCGSKTVLDAYILKDGYIAGDSAKSIKPIRNIIVWPLANNSSGTKAKGVESKMTDLFIDKLYLIGGFDSVSIVSPDRANDLLTRTGEELGLKRKPKDVDSGLVATKVGQLAGGDAIFMGGVSDFDEDKTDKATESVVGGTFYLIDAREKAYPVLDSFTPVKYLWRTNIKQVSTETVIAGRESLDNTSRKLVDKVVRALVNDISGSQREERRALETKIAELKSKADDNLDNEDFDKAVTNWNEIQKLDPGNAEAKTAIEQITKAKKDAEERKRVEALKKEIDTLKDEASALEKEGKYDEAINKWLAILEKDKENRDPQGKIEKLKARIAEENERKKSQEISKQLYMAQKSFDEKKYNEAIDGAKKVLELDAANEKAKAILSDANAKIEEGKAAEVKQEAPAPEEPAVSPAPAPAPPPERAASPAPAPAQPEPVVSPAPAQARAATNVSTGEIAVIRKQAVEFFDKEEYQKSNEQWKKLLALDPNDAQAKEMVDTTDMLIKALQ